jgi:hypothetical protein
MSAKTFLVEVRQHGLFTERRRRHLALHLTCRRAVRRSLFARCPILDGPRVWRRVVCVSYREGSMMMVTLRLRSLVWFVTGALLAQVVGWVVMSAWRVDAAPGDVDTTTVPITARVAWRRVR